MLPLILVVGAGKRIDVDERRRSDDPLGEVLLRGCFLGEVTRRDRVTVEHDRRDAGGLHLRDHLHGSCLDGRRIELIGNDLGER